MGVGSYAVPGWYIAAQRQMREGVFGPHDIEDATNDAVRVIVQDQIEAGLDVLSDGEVRRQRFVYEMFQLMEGLQRVPSRRKLGIAGYDMAPGFTSSEPVGARRPESARRTCLPEIRGRRTPDQDGAAGTAHLRHAHRTKGRPPAALLDEIVEILRTEVAALNSQGVSIFQLDEPSPRCAWIVADRGCRSIKPRSGCL